jgi:oligoendopeptidase F
LFEGYAVFNELLLLDEAARTATSPEARLQALEAFCATISTELFTSAEETTFENSLYEAASGGPLLSRARIDSLYRASIAPYTSWPMSDVGMSQSWMAKPLLWEDPLYYVNYLYSSLVAVALFEKAHSDPNFGRKYEAMLSRGFDTDPTTLLATVGIALGDRAMIARAVALFSAKVDELQAAYAVTP